MATRFDCAACKEVKILNNEVIIWRCLRCFSVNCGVCKAIFQSCRCDLTRSPQDHSGPVRSLLNLSRHPARPRLTSLNQTRRPSRPRLAAAKSVPAVPKAAREFCAACSSSYARSYFKAKKHKANLAMKRKQEEEESKIIEM